MFSEKCTSPLNALANPSCAAGAMSWISCSIPRPSSLAPPFCTVWSCSTVTGERSPLATSIAALVVQLRHLSKLSESAPMRMPRPSKPRACARSAFSSATAWLCTEPALVCGAWSALITRTPETPAAPRADPSGR